MTDTLPEFLLPLGGAHARAVFVTEPDRGRVGTPTAQVAGSSGGFARGSSDSASSAATGWRILGRQRLRLGRRLPRRARPRRRRGAAQHAACRGRPRPGPRRPRSRGDRRRSRRTCRGCPSATGAGSSCRRDVDVAGPAAPALDGSEARPEEVGVLCYTSGTTGEPRGVMIRNDVPGAERRDVRAHLPVRARQRDGRRVPALPQHRLQRRPRPHAAGQRPGRRAAPVRSRPRSRAPWPRAGTRS